MGGWWTIRRVVFVILGWLLLGLAAFNASMVPEDRRIPHFIGGSIWALLCFAVALWPRRRSRAPSKRPDAEPLVCSQSQKK